MLFPKLYHPHHGLLADFVLRNENQDRPDERYPFVLKGWSYRASVAEGNEFGMGVHPFSITIQQKILLLTMSVSVGSLAQSVLSSCHHLLYATQGLSHHAHEPLSPTCQA